MIMHARPQLRTYQVAGVQRLRQAFRQHRTVLCVLPTGGGKTVVAAWLVDSAVAMGKRVLFLAHRTELIEQASAKLHEFGVAHGVIKSGHPRQDLARAVQVASVQTLVRRLAKAGTAAWLASFDLVVVDEAHHTAAGSYQQILDAYPRAKVLGLTATPYRLDGAGLGDSYEHLEALATVPELIGGGFLVPTRTFAPPPPTALSAVHVRAGEFRVDEAAHVLDQVGPVQEIVDTWLRYAVGRVTVAFGCTVKHAARIAHAFTARGIPAAAIDGDSHPAVRDQALQDLASGRLQVLANCSLLTEGWDLPACAAVILARPTKSRSLWRQMVGRGMRSAPNKADCLILDHAANCARFGTPDEADAYSLHTVVPEEYALPGYVLCPRCAALNREGDYRCGECEEPLPRPRSASGHTGVKRNRITDSERETVERKALDLAEARTLTKAERETWYHERLAEAEARHHKLGWAAHRYHDRFGAWPPASWLKNYHQSKVPAGAGHG